MAPRKTKRQTHWHMANGLFVTEAIVGQDGLIVAGPLCLRKGSRRRGDVTLRLSVDLSGVTGRSLTPRQLTALKRQLRTLVRAAQEAIDTNEPSEG